jgi:RNA polymerase sigma-70 factor (ECF subfamily)
MRRIRDGDEGALGQFYDRYSALVYAVCLRVLGQTSDAEETTIDVFWEIWEKPNRYDEQRGTVVSYLLVLARSRAIDRRRSRGSHPTLTLEDTSEDGERPRHPAVPSQTPEPAQHAWLNEQRDEVVKALDRLTGTQREALVLSFFQGLSHQQIAERLEQPLGTVKTRIRQGIIRLREGLRSLDGEG